MKIYKLYVKTHVITGLKYLGQTTQNPLTYKGSGVDWVKHIKKYGYHVSTEILLETDNKKNVEIYGRYYSQLWNVVCGQDDYGNKIWANKIPETTAGGGNNRPDISSKTTQRLLSENIHPFIGGKMQKQTQRAIVASGNHHFSSGEIQKASNKIRVIDKTHNFLGPETNKKTLENNTHSFLSITKLQWCCICCRKEGKGLSNLSIHYNKCDMIPL
jgi:hypothetical protein